MRTVLTVVIDHKLCWKPHVNNFKTKAPKSITSILNLIHTSMRYILCGGLREKKTIKQSWLSQTNKHIVHKFTCTPIHWSYRSKNSITDVQTMQQHVSRRYPEVVPNKKKKKRNCLFLICIMLLCEENKTPQKPASWEAGKVVENRFWCMAGLNPNQSLVVIFPAESVCFPVFTVAWAHGLFMCGMMLYASLRQRHERHQSAVH